MTTLEYVDFINTYLAGCLPGSDKLYSGLLESMSYSLTAGGKRIRPILALEFARITGADLTKVLPVACAVEMVHTYSLIHDDLPCMDNDDFRRGKPTNHKVYGEATAVIAGDALQAEAFRTILTSELSDRCKVRCAEVLADAIGPDGMCGGQYLDTVAEFDTRTAEYLDFINNLKTGALLSAACKIGAAASDSSEELICAAGNYGTYLGLAFQIRDDILDVVGNVNELGKTIGSDEKDKKLTYMSLLGEERCMSLVEQLTIKAKQSLVPLYRETDFLYSLADSLIWRCS